MIDDIERSLLAAEKKRCNAMLANDLAALDALLDPRLTFSHATGVVDDKPAYMAKLSAGRITYLAIDWSETQVIALAQGAALLTGRMTCDVTVEAIAKRLENRVLAAWAKTGDAWRLVAFQSTPSKA